MLVGAGVRYVARRGVGRSVDEATTILEDRLPSSMVTAVNALPGDVMKAGGAAVVSARAVRRGARAGQRGAQMSGAVVARARQVTIRPARPALADRIRSVRMAVIEQADDDSREFQADFQRYVHGGGPAGERAAIEALLDQQSTSSDRPLPVVPEPVRAGRRRSKPARREPEVARVQRTYRKPKKPWDRRPRSEPGPKRPAIS